MIYFLLPAYNEVRPEKGEIKNEGFRNNLFLYQTRFQNSIKQLID